MLISLHDYHLQQPLPGIKYHIIQNIKPQAMQIIQILGVTLTPRGVNRMDQEFAKMQN